MLIAPGEPAKQDYEYVRKGTTNLFVAVEHKAGMRFVSVTDLRAKTDFVGFVQTLLTETRCVEPSSGSSADRMQIASSGVTTFRDLCVDVLGMLGQGFASDAASRELLAQQSCRRAQRGDDFGLMRLERGQIGLHRNAA